MPDRMSPPPDCDLTRPSGEIAAACGVSPATVRRWKKEAGAPVRPGREKGGMSRTNPELAARVTGEDWAKGDIHVGKLLGVSRQTVRYMLWRLERENAGIRETDQGQG